MSAFSPIVVFLKLYLLIKSFGAKGVEKVGLIHVDFGQVDYSQFESRWNRELSQWVHRIPIDIEVHFGAENGILDFKVVFQGNTIGQASIEYERN